MAHWKLSLRLICCVMVFALAEGYVYVEKESTGHANQKSDDGLLTTGRSYRIRNKRSNMFMTAVGAGIQQWPLKTGEDRDGQVWFVTPLERDTYVITNKLTGLSINQGHATGKQPAAVLLGSLTFLPDGVGAWFIREDPAASSKGSSFYTIENRSSKGFLLLAGYSVAAGGVVQDHPTHLTTQLDSRRWVFEIEEEFPVSQEAINRSAADIGDVPRITAVQLPAAAKTDEVLIGQLTIPFALIADPTLSESQQVKISRHYSLRRYGYWRRVTYHEHDGLSHVTMTSNVTVGLVTNNAKAMDRVVGLCVTAEASLCVRASRMTAMIPAIANRLKIDVDEDFAEVNSGTMLLDRKYVTLNRQNHAVWFREDRYVLERADGRKVLDWITRIPETIGDGFRGRQLLLPSNT